MCACHPSGVLLGASATSGALFPGSLGSPPTHRSARSSVTGRRVCPRQSRADARYAPWQDGLALRDSAHPSLGVLSVTPRHVLRAALQQDYPSCPLCHLHANVVDTSSAVHLSSVGRTEGLTGPPRVTNGELPELGITVGPLALPPLLALDFDSTTPSLAP